MSDEDRIPLLEGPTVRLDVYTPDTGTAAKIVEQFSRMAIGYADDDMVASIIVCPRHVTVEVGTDLIVDDDG